ncbi:hypothetical protein KEJ44_00350 [Candidatus Bathyarchaeota archaeon]|nr:hypothetical protein [Candidatus Bathyarchaeota archaeon]
MRNIAYLLRTNPNIRMENEARLFLVRLQREHPKELITVTKEGIIFSEAEDGTITKIGADGKTVEVYPAMSEAAEKALMLFPGYEAEKAEEAPAASEVGKKVEGLFPHYDERFKEAAKKARTLFPHRGEEND